ncbi:MAG: response regulator, partial [Promethearchaeota archaeon]
MAMITGLLVDDDPNMLLILDRFCERYNICCDKAENGEQAIKNLKENPNSYNFILTDIEMPLKDGYAVVQYCHDNCEDLPIFMM